MFVLWIAAFGGAGTALGATFTVNTTADDRDVFVGDGNCATATGECSVRAAIEETNYLPGMDAVFIPSGAYVLSASGGSPQARALFIRDDLAVVGSGPELTTLSGGNQAPVFYIVPQSGEPPPIVEISDVTVRDGSPNGIWSQSADLTIRRVWLTANSGLVGAGIFNGERLTVIDSTISGNDAGSGFGGGIGTQSAEDLTIVNSTISSNIARIGAGIYSNIPTVTIQNSTIAHNGGHGLYAFNFPVSLNSTIVSSNTGGDCAGIPNSTGHNLDSDGTCRFTEPGDLSALDPNLGSLADNGGPTLTHLPLAGSPVIDAGDNLACPVTDQRGKTRYVDGNSDGVGGCDVGAVEVNSVVAVGGLAEIFMSSDANSSSSGPAIAAGIVAALATVVLLVHRRRLRSA